jgi:hypothetical protein
MQTSPDEGGQRVNHVVLNTPLELNLASLPSLGGPLTFPAYWAWFNPQQMQGLGIIVTIELEESYVLEELVDNTHSRILCLPRIASHLHVTSAEIRSQGMQRT